MSTTACYMSEERVLRQFRRHWSERLHLLRDGHVNTLCGMPVRDTDRLDDATGAGDYCAMCKAVALRRGFLRFAAVRGGNGS